MSAFTQMLQQFGKAQAKRPKGDGWKTLGELAQEAQTTLPSVRYQLQCARKAGAVIEQATGTVLNDEGRAIRATYYRVVKAP